jgi:hypothetical protein
MSASIKSYTTDKDKNEAIARRLRERRGGLGYLAALVANARASGADPLRALAENARKNKALEKQEADNNTQG